MDRLAPGTWRLAPLVSHPFRSGNAEKIQAVSENELRRAREHQTGLHDRLWLVQHVIFVIPEMNLSSCVVQIIRDEVRLEPPGSTLDEVRIVEQRLHQLPLFRRFELG